MVWALLMAWICFCWRLSVLVTELSQVRSTFTTHPVNTAASSQHVRLVNSALSRQHLLHGRQLIIGRHCYNIQALLLCACWISCLATHRISVSSWYLFSFVALYISSQTTDEQERRGLLVGKCAWPWCFMPWEKCVCGFTPHWEIIKTLVSLSMFVLTSQPIPKCKSVKKTLLSFTTWMQKHGERNVLIVIRHQ